MTVLLSACSEKYIVLDPKGPIGQSQKDLIIITTLLCAVIIVPVLILAGFIVWRYRDKPGRKDDYKPKWSHDTRLEVTWWAIPIIIIAILATVTVRYTYALEPSRPIESAEKTVTIQVASLDWKWLFLYPEEGIATVNYIKFPDNVPVRFELTSDAPMNSFWIPQLGGQIYTMSGMAMTLHLQADQTGKYFGSSANFSGKDFAQMRFVAEASTKDEFDAWVKEVKATGNALTTDGYEQLQKPSVEEQQQFSSFPEGLFQKIVTKYVPEGSQGHHHGGGAVSSNEQKQKPVQPETSEDADSSHNAAQSTHAGH
ncbi:ubiquinol oxidase subunit II [Paenibacillus sp. GCM10012307]|uniref:Quinol oxidase subunit 2 n=1 Tax=Paenibacillus roseus TaxID=2798579 RepID=A0A934MQZ6_9BACL|nr:ubiquinol oxidase subunit II [Paenibacillus roseus]MBJ6363701.1 ubiquinol oxidase subunit II [Paenibacillus roseus]